jgi:hypothetical protein
MLSDYSENKEVAAEFIRFIGSRDAQKDRAIRVSLLPTIGSLYRDDDVLAAQPFMEALFDVFNSAVARPSTVTGELYNEVSAAYFNAVHSILTGEEAAADAVMDLEEQLMDITGFSPGAPPDADVEASAGGTLTGGGPETPDFLTRDYEGASLKVYFGPQWANEAEAHGDLIAQT